MSPKETTGFRLDRALLETMRSVKEHEGIPVTTQIEMAVRDWLKKRGPIVKQDRPRASKARRRS